MENYIKKEVNEMEETNIKKEENLKMEINKNKFRFELATKIEIGNDDEQEEEDEFKPNSYIKKVIELSEDKLGIFYGDTYNGFLFFIYSSKTFTLIKQFENYFIDAVQMEDNVLVLCDEYNIYFYKLINKEYKLIKKIQCYEKDKDNSYSRRGERNPNTRIYFLYHLKNDDLIVSSHSEMKIYKKKDGEYSLKRMLKNVKYFIKNITEIRPNVIVLFLIETVGSSCCPDGYQYYISLYDLQNNKYKILNNNFSWNDENEKYKINHFLKSDQYLFAKYKNCLYIYDIEQNMKFINEADYENINKDSGREQKYLKYIIPFQYFKIEIINNFILVTKKDDKSFVYNYSFEDKLFKECQEFPFKLADAGIMKLKNDKLIIYSDNVIKVINIFYKK